MIPTLRASLKKIRPYIGPLIVLVTGLLFVYFFVHNPKLRHALAQTSPTVVLVVGLLYVVFMLCLAWVYALTLRLCGRSIPAGENVLLTCYSTIANFFGPLQSGPGVRAAYLKQKHNIRLRDYTVATLFYYALYAIVSAIFLLIGSGKYWPLALGAAFCVAGGSFAIVWYVRRKFSRKDTDSGLRFEPKVVLLLLLATICQLVCVALIYFVELRAVGSSASPAQALTYGGAANFSLFVSLTPGAIGFREAFLAFSQQLHHVPSSQILAASIIDRAIFVGFLGVMFLVIVTLHANKRFGKLRKKPDEIRS